MLTQETLDLLGGVCHTLSPYAVPKYSTREATCGSFLLFAAAKLLYEAIRRSRSDGASVSPNALAVFKLITSSNLVGCSTGRSAGRGAL